MFEQAFRNIGDKKKRVATPQELDFDHINFITPIPKIPRRDGSDLKE
jgi:hypothetical protein